MNCTCKEPEPRETTPPNMIYRRGKQAPKVIACKRCGRKCKKQ